MSSYSHNNKLFTDSGCLSQYTFEHFSDPQFFTEKERKMIEEHLDGCLLCSDALEGVSGLSQDSSSLASHTDTINKRLRFHFAYNPSLNRSAANGPSLKNLLIPAAAMIIIMIGLISYFHFLFPDNQELAMAKSDELPVVSEEKEMMPKASMLPDTSTEISAATIGGVYSYETPDAAEDEIADNSVQDIPEDDDKAELIAVNEEISVMKEEPAAPAEEAIEAEYYDLTEADVSATEEMAMAGKGEEPPMNAKGRSAKSVQKKESRETITFSIDQAAEYPGGVDSLYRFLQKNLLHPITQDTSVSINVIAQFIVNKRGHITDIEIIHSGGNEMDEDLNRVLKLMPKWNPGRQDGKDISSMQKLSVWFISK